MQSFNFNSGGQEAIYRIISAYGFKNRQALCDHLAIPKSTLATRFMRDAFPADWVLQCALETGVNIQWLVTGLGEMGDVGAVAPRIELKTLKNGKEIKSEYLVFDEKFTPEQLKSPLAVKENNTTYILDTSFSEVFGGEWLVDIEGRLGIQYLERIPVNKIRISGGELKSPIECNVDDIKIIGNVVMTCK